jgi:hypothetical protein
MFEEKIARGMAAFDRYFGAEDWVYEIDPAKFKMNECGVCVVGQLLGWTGENLGYLLPEMDELFTLEDEDDEDFSHLEEREQQIIGEHGFDFTPQLSYAIERRVRKTGRPTDELSALAWRQLEREWLVAIKKRIDEGVKV